MNWVDKLKAEREHYADALANQRIAPGMNWPQSQQHYLNMIAQITQLLQQLGVEDSSYEPEKIAIGVAIPK
jgi:hypothetical protein